MRGAVAAGDEVLRCGPAMPSTSDVPVWREACLCAVSDGVPRRSLVVAVVVGVILNLINQGDALVAGHPLDWTKILLTFFVPYGVSTYGAVSYHLRRARRPAAQPDPGG